MQWSTCLVVWALCLGRPCASDDVDLSSLLGKVRTPAKFCGVQLAHALSAVCKGNYNDLHQAQQARNARNYGYYSDQPMPYPYQTRQQARDFLSGRSRHRRRRGVYNECCEKPCTHEELSTYCGGGR